MKFIKSNSYKKKPPLVKFYDSGNSLIVANDYNEALEELKIFKDDITKSQFDPKIGSGKTSQVSWLLKILGFFDPLKIFSSSKDKQNHDRKFYKELPPFIKVDPSVNVSEWLKINYAKPQQQNLNRYDNYLPIYQELFEEGILNINFDETYIQAFTNDIIAWFERKEQAFKRKIAFYKKKIKKHFKLNLRSRIRTIISILFKNMDDASANSFFTLNTNIIMT